MRAPLANRLLAAWEQGQAEPPHQRALLLLGAGCDDAPKEIASWSIGRRDAELLELRERLFGPELQSWTFCPQCGERVEFQPVSRALLEHAPTSSAKTHLVHWRDWAAEFRLPTSVDLEVLVAAEHFTTDNWEVTSVKQRMFY